MVEGVGIRVELGKERIEVHISRRHVRSSSTQRFQFRRCALSQYVIPISRCIVVAVVRCSRERQMSQSRAHRPTVAEYSMKGIGAQLLRRTWTMTSLLQVEI